MTATIRLQAKTSMPPRKREAPRGRVDIGAVVTFSGICRGSDGDGYCRDDARALSRMAEAEIARHVEEAQRRWVLKGVTVIHRYGRLVPGDNIVLVVTAAEHRGDAFAAAEFLMDYLKTSAPFWKQEERADSRIWVEAKATDIAAAARWSQPPRECTPSKNTPRKREAAE